MTPIYRTTGRVWPIALAVLSLAAVAAVPKVALADQETGAVPAPECAQPAQPPYEAATPPARGPSAGTAPGGSGSTGWTGGTGGSYVGTTPQAPMPGSPTAHPPTVSGVNPQPEPQRPC